jgi:hypothetical protein
VMEGMGIWHGRAEEWYCGGAAQGAHEGYLLGVMEHRDGISGSIGGWVALQGAGHSRTEALNARGVW